MDRVGADFYHSVDTIVDRLKAQSGADSDSGRRRRSVQGHRRPGEMKAVIWRDETLGAEFDVVDIPEDLVEKAQGVPRADDRSGFRIRRHAVRKVHRTAKPLTNDEIQRRHPQGHHRAEDFPGDLRVGVQEQGRADHAGRGGGLPALAARHSAGRRASTSTIPKITVDAQASRRRAVRRAGLQDHDRPVLGPAGVLPGLFGQDDGGRIGVQRGQGPQGARRAACCACTPTSAKTFRKSWRAISAPRWG